MTSSGLFARNVPGTTEELATLKIGVAGCGGLGSNAAVSLVRAGVGKLVLADVAEVELSDLNRAHFFRDDVGEAKVAALAGHLRAINPDVELACHAVEVNDAGLESLFGDVDLLIITFGGTGWLVDTWRAVHPDKPLVIARGLAGYGKVDLGVVHDGSVHVCGDGITDSDIGLCAPRVALVANMQANLAIQLLLNSEGTEDE